MTPTPPRSSVIRGRDAELAALDGLLDALGAGRGATVVIEGEAGLGKTRLLGYVAERARRRGIRTGVSTTEPAEGSAELAPLLRALCTGPTPLIDGAQLARAGSSPEQRYWLLADLEALLERAALTAPLLICLDDLHWSDPGTVAVLRALPGRLATVPVGWVLSTRPDQGPPALRRTLDELAEAGAPRLRLRPLGEASVAGVAADLLDGTPDAALMRVAAGAGGNPFLLVELLAGLRDEGLVRAQGGQVALTGARLPDRVQLSMRLRLERLPRPAQDAALAAASLERAFSVSELALMLETSPAALVAPTAALLDAGILRENDQKLSFVHDLTREAVRTACPPPARRALDRRATDVHLAGGALPVEVATQLADSAEPGDEDAIATLADAAETLGRADPGAAADLTRRALELTPRGHPRRAALIGQTTVLLHAANRSPEAKRFADQRLDGELSVAEESEICLSIASLFALAPDERVAANRRALALPGLPGDHRARHLARLTYNLFQTGQPAQARAAMPGALAAAEAAGDDAALAILHHIQGSLLYADDRYHEAFAVHEAVMREGFGEGETTRWLVALLWRTQVLAVIDRLDEALQVMAEGIAAAREDRQGWAVDYFETWRGCQLFQRGELSDAAATLDGRFALDGPGKVVAGVPAAGLAALGRVALHTGDQRRLRPALRIARQMFDEGAPVLRRQAAWLLALDAFARGDRAAAARWITVDRTGQDGLLPMYPIDVTDDPHLVRIALACGLPETATATAADARRRAERNPGVVSVQASAAHARGLVDGDRAALAEAVALFEQVGRPLALAAAAEDLGVAALADGDREAGLAALDRALVAFSGCGAEADERRVRERLRDHGVRRRLVQARRPKDGWGSLTASEVAVARLVAEGLTNREASERLIVSPHTVNGHLRSVFAKLGISSRVDLARLVSERGTPDEPGAEA